MELTDNDIRLVQESWSKVMPAAEQVASLFYGRLFELYPEVRPLFHTNMREQGRKLMSMINLAVISLDRMDALVPTVQESGRRHLEYGVTEADYDKVANALLWTLEQGLGEDFTAETRTAWIAVYTTLADTMKAAAQGTSD